MGWRPGCGRIDAVLHNTASPAWSEWPLNSRGFAAGHARWRGLCRQESAGVTKDATAVSGLAKLFPGGIPARGQRMVRMSTETGLSPKCRLGDSGDSVHESPLSKPTTSGTSCQADIPIERNDYAFAIVQPDADLTACACTSGHCVAPPYPFLRSTIVKAAAVYG